jgi:hypothetical protein
MSPRIRVRGLSGEFVECVGLSSSPHTIIASGIGGVGPRSWGITWVDVLTGVSSKITEKIMIVATPTVRPIRTGSKAKFKSHSIIDILDIDFIQ